MPTPFNVPMLDDDKHNSPFMHTFLSGVKAGMFVRDAKACCPNLVTIPYDFEAYQEVIFT